MKNLLFTLLLLLCAGATAKAQSNATLEHDFLNPKDEHKPIIIWQWMDGLVTREGITADLEAFKEAGLAGVQNFQIGGPRQIRVSDTTNAIGSEKWKGLMRWAMDECERLGLTFGTHNCPGWSSSAYPTVEPRYSMLQLVYSEVPVPTNKRTKAIHLPRPEVDTVWNYYEDVAVMAVPADSVAEETGEVMDLTTYYNKETETLQLPKGLPTDYVVLRIGQTTIGKTNEAQSPESGRGLECDITEALAKGNNHIEVEVTNLWPNRMIGDEQEPEDVEWGETLKYDYASGSPVAGQYMAKLPDWLLQGKPRPSQGRKSFYAFKFFRADSPLLPSGLFGPVEVLVKK